MLAHLSVRFPVRHSGMTPSAMLLIRRILSARSQQTPNTKPVKSMNGIPYTLVCLVAQSHVQIPLVRMAYEVVYTKTTPKEKLRSLSSWIALSRPKALSWV